jgi:hypothetical protein
MVFTSHRCRLCGPGVPIRLTTSGPRWARNGHVRHGPAFRTSPRMPPFGKVDDPVLDQRPPQPPAPVARPVARIDIRSPGVIQGDGVEDGPLHAALFPAGHVKLVLDPAALDRVLREDEDDLMELDGSPAPPPLRHRRRAVPTRRSPRDGDSRSTNRRTVAPVADTLYHNIHISGDESCYDPIRGRLENHLTRDTATWY